MKTIEIAYHSMLGKMIDRIAVKDIPAGSLLSSEHFDGF